MNHVLMKYSVQIAVALILLLVRSVQCISQDMRLLQNNIQSVSTSLPLLCHIRQRLQINIALLQEAWHPMDDTINIRSYARPILKLRQGSEGGGVAIITRQNVKTVHLYEYDVAELEAVWADVTCNNIFVVVGSVYIAPGDMTALDILDTVIDNILRKQSCICTAMDANARSSPLDDSAI